MTWADSFLIRFAGWLQSLCPLAGLKHCITFSYRCVCWFKVNK